MKERMVYAARIFQDGEYYHAEFPQLDLVTQGNDFDEVLHMASDALETYFADFLNDLEPPPTPKLDIPLEEGDILAIISVYADPLLDFTLLTPHVMSALQVSKQRVQQYRDANMIRAVKNGRDYLHSEHDVSKLKTQVRTAGRPAVKSSVR